MLGRSVPALALGAVTALVEIFTGRLPVFAGLTGLVVALVATGCLYQSAMFRKWAVIRTYELSFWNDDMDARLPDEDWQVAGGLPSRGFMRARATAA